MNVYSMQHDPKAVYNPFVELFADSSIVYKWHAI